MSDPRRTKAYAVGFEAGREFERLHPVSDATPDLAAALERLAAKVPGVEPFRDVPGYGPCWCEGWERGYHEGWHHSEICKRNRDDAEAIAEFRAALASEPVPATGPVRRSVMYPWTDEPVPATGNPEEPTDG